MDESHTVTERTGWFQRMGRSLSGVLIGLLLVAGAVALLWWNEGRAVTTAKALDQGATDVVDVSSDLVDPADDGKLIHVTGLATTDEILEDPTFGVSSNALLLERRVEMYQWEEEKETTREKQVGGSVVESTKSTYKQVWSNRPIDSSRFSNQERKNPTEFPYEENAVHAENATLGAYQLPRTIISMINQFAILPVTAETIEKLPAFMRDKAHISAERLFLGSDPGAPSVGDVRIGFYAVRPTTISVVAQQADHSFSPYPTKAGESIQLVEVGTVSSEQMFAAAVSRNKAMTWILRLVGFVLMAVGFGLIFAPLSVFADVIPIFGDIVGMGTGILSFLLALFGSFVTIGIAWFFFRPFLSILLLAIAVAAAAGIFWKAKQKRTERVSAPS